MGKNNLAKSVHWDAFYQLGIKAVETASEVI